MSEQAARQVELKQICYIDDSKTSTYVTKKILSKYGYFVDHFPDAESALDAIMENDYEVLITDLMISADGGVNGDDLIRIIRNSGHPLKSQIPIIVVTGSCDDETESKLLQAGANNVLAKPIDGEALHEILQKLLPIQAVTTTQESVDQDTTKESDDEPNKVVEEIIVETKSPILKTKERTDVVKNERDESIEVEDLGLSYNSPEVTQNSEPDIPVLTAIFDVNSTKESEKKDSTPTVMPPEKVEKKKTFSKSDGSIKASDVFSVNDVIANESVAIQPLKVSEKIPEKSDVKARIEQPIKNAIITEQKAPAPTLDKSQTEEAKIEVKVDKVEKQAPVNSPKPAEIPKIVEPQKSANKPAAKTTAKAQTKKSTDADNPLLSLLKHLDDNDSHQTIGSKVKQKSSTKPSSFKFNKWFFRLAWLVLIASLIIPASVFWYKSQQVIGVDVVAVKESDIHNEISVPGIVVSKRTIKVTSRAAGQVVQVLVKEGDDVQKNENLVKMDDQEAISNVKQAQARVLSGAEQVALTSKTQERLQRGLDLGAVSRQAVEDAEAAWKSASAKQSVLEEELKEAELKLEHLQIKAPFAGLISSVSVQEGQWIKRADPILTLVDMSQRAIQIRVDVSDTSRLNVGQTVVLASDAFDGMSWQETITRIGSEANTKDSVNSIKVFTSLGQDAPNLRIGQQVDATIRVASRTNALILPYNVIFTHEGSSHVAVIENGRIVFLPIVTGIESISDVEIVKGLRPGQQIIVPNGLPLEAGMRAAARNLPPAKP